MTARAHRYWPRGIVAGSGWWDGEVVGAQDAYLAGIGGCLGDAQGLGGDGLLEQVADVAGIAEVLAARGGGKQGVEPGCYPVSELQARGAGHAGEDLGE